MTQLDLFDAAHVASRADIVAFPSDRLRGVILDTVRTLRAKEGSKREWHFRNACGHIWSRLTLAGVPRPEIEREVARFAGAVNAELRKQGVLDRLYGQDGAA